MVALYYGGVARVVHGQPDDPGRDRIIVSKGHAAMVQYPILADLGFYDEAELERFTQPGGLLGMYADFRIPGIEGISGSLGRAALVHKSEGGGLRCQPAHFYSET